MNLHDEIKAQAYEQVKVDQIRKAIQVLELEEAEKKLELEALQELVDDNENAVLGSLVPHLHGMSLDTVLQDMYGNKAEKMAKQMAVAALYKDDSDDTARVVDHVLGKRQKAHAIAQATIKQSMRDMNEERRKILQQRREIAARRKQLLAGSADTVSLSSTRSIVLADRPDSATNIALKTKEGLVQQIERISKLKESLKKDSKYNVEYDGRYGRHTYRREQIPAYNFCKTMVMMMVEDATEQFEVNVPDARRASIANKIYTIEKVDIQTGLLEKQQLVVARDIYSEIETVRNSVAWGWCWGGHSSTLVC